MAKKTTKKPTKTSNSKNLVKDDSASTDGASAAASKQANDGMSLHDHLRELRRRLMYSLLSFLSIFIVSFYFAKPIFNFLTMPLYNIWQDDENRRMIFTALHEQFITEIKVAMFVAFAMTLPLILVQIWMFVAPGLYKNEKKVFLPFILATPILFLLGASFVYYLVLPVAWEFFSGFEQLSSDDNLAIALEPKVNEYLSLVMRLIFAFGLCFELPILLLLLVKIGVTDRHGLRKKRRYAIVFAFVVAAVLTPPDPLSQLGLAIPIILLYEISIICAWLMGKKAE